MSNVFQRPQLQPLETLRKRGKLTHVLSEVNKVLASLDEGEYGNVQAVTDFKEEMREEKEKEKKQRLTS